MFGLLGFLLLLEDHLVRGVLTEGEVVVQLVQHGLVPVREHRDLLQELHVDLLDDVVVLGCIHSKP